jgi:hypothetical protein
MGSPENTKLCDFTSTKNNDFICTPIAPPAPEANFYEIKHALLNLVMKEQFSGASSDDVAAHLNNFVELYEMQKYKDVDGNIIKLKLFPFSIRRRAKDWLLSLPRNSIDSWDKCKDAFIGKYYPPALMKIREEKLKQKAFIPKKLEDGWEPIIDMHVNGFDCHALCDLGASISIMPRKIYDMLGLPPLEKCYFNVSLADVAKKKPLGRINVVIIMVNNNPVPVDFLVMDVECNASCPIILERPFLRTVGAIIDMKEGTIKYQFPLKKGMEHFPRRRNKLLFDSILRANYELDASSFDIT